MSEKLLQEATALEDVVVQLEARGRQLSDFATYSNPRPLPDSLRKELLTLPTPRESVVSELLPQRSAAIADGFRSLESSLQPHTALLAKPTMGGTSCASSGQLDFISLTAFFAPPKSASA